VREFLDRIFLDNTGQDWLVFAAIVLGILLFSRWITRIISFIIYRLFRRLTAESRLKQFARMVQKPLSAFIVMFSAYLSFSLLNYPVELDFEVHGVMFSTILMKAYQAAMAIVFTWLLIRLINFMSLVFLERAEKTDSKADDQIVLFAKDMSKVVVVIMVIFFILGSVFDFNITSLLAGAGIVGLAIAFAAKESIENFFGSLTIFADKPFSVGDLVQVGSVMGTVEKVGFRSTRIRTLDKTFVTIPNRTLNTDNTENLTLRTFRRVDMMVGVVYSTSSEQLAKIVADIQAFIDQHHLTNQDGIVGLFEFGDSSLNIRVTYFVQNVEWNVYVKTREEVNFEIIAIVHRHGSDFAFPTRTIHVFNEA
jgi:MscS family membrane protein